MHSGVVGNCKPLFGVGSVRTLSVKVGMSCMLTSMEIVKLSGIYGNLQTPLLRKVRGACNDEHTDLLPVDLLTREGHPLIRLLPPTQVLLSAKLA